MRGNYFEFGVNRIVAIDFQHIVKEMSNVGLDVFVVMMDGVGCKLAV
jgi:hypothetical protein